MIQRRRNVVLSAATLALALTSGCGREADVSEPGQVIGTNRLEPVDNAKGTSVYTMSRAVAKASLGNGGLCTAFRVAGDLFVTNNHCYEASVCSQTSFTLGYERDVPASQRTTFSCKGTLSNSASLDYALFQVNGAAGAPDTWPSMRLSRKAPATGTLVLVPGFPAGYQYKRVDRSDDCKISTTSGNVGSNSLGYTCDTNGGSSGSPVIERATGDVIGLHYGHRGNGTNAAYRMSAILDHIRTNAPSAYAKLTIVD